MEYINILSEITDFYTWQGSHTMPDGTDNFIRSHWVEYKGRPIFVDRAEYERLKDLKKQFNYENYIIELWEVEDLTFKISNKKLDKLAKQRKCKKHILAGLKQKYLQFCRDMHIKEKLSTVQ